jgi:hypothetical protein
MAELSGSERESSPELPRTKRVRKLTSRAKESRKEDQLLLDMKDSKLYCVHM